jgi:hypothetical protein
MTKPHPPPKVPGATPFERFETFTKRLIAVPKKEIDREEQKWQRKRKRR